MYRRPNLKHKLYAKNSVQIIILKSKTKKEWNCNFEKEREKERKKRWNRSTIETRSVNNTTTVFERGWFVKTFNASNKSDRPICFGFCVAFDCLKTHLLVCNHIIQTDTDTDSNVFFLWIRCELWILRLKFRCSFVLSLHTVTCQKTKKKKTTTHRRVYSLSNAFLLLCSRLPFSQHFFFCYCCCCYCCMFFVLLFFLQFQFVHSFVLVESSLFCLCVFHAFVCMCVEVLMYLWVNNTQLNSHNSKLLTNAWV